MKILTATFTNFNLETYRTKSWTRNISCKSEIPLPYAMRTLLNSFWISAWWLPLGVETCSLLNHYFIKFCFDGCRFPSHLYLQHSGMHKVKIWRAGRSMDRQLFCSLHVSVSGTAIIRRLKVHVKRLFKYSPLQWHFFQIAEIQTLNNLICTLRN